MRLAPQTSEASGFYVAQEAPALDCRASPHPSLTAQDLQDSSYTETLMVFGDSGDSVDAGTGWTDGGIAEEFHVYTHGLATLNLDTDLTVNPDIFM